ncbi:MAG: hypothetical protein II348_05940, partial [Clostridia bacterium]|nr:hypothetical protein [Clostridia bacterium]
REWNKGNIVVVTGFQGVNDQGDFVTLGRGGSDTSAVALAASVKADRCMIFTDVDGVYSADPRKIPNAIRFESIHPDTMLDLAVGGAKVLHPRAAALIKQYGLPTEILTSFSHRAGTMIESSAPRRTGVTMLNLPEDFSVVSAVTDGMLSGAVLSQMVEKALEFSQKFRYMNGIFRIEVDSKNAELLMRILHDVLYPV